MTSIDQKNEARSASGGSISRHAASSFCSFSSLLSFHRCSVHRGSGNLTGSWSERITYVRKYVGQNRGEKKIVPRGLIAGMPRGLAEFIHDITDQRFVSWLSTSSRNSSAHRFGAPLAYEDVVYELSFSLNYPFRLCVSLWRIRIGDIHLHVDLRATVRCNNDSHSRT